MFYTNLIVCLCLTSYVSAAPAEIPPEKLQPTVIPIVSQSEEFEPNGTYKFSYETGNGIKREEIAYEKVVPKSREASSNEAKENEDYSDEIHVQQGSYSYTAPDGTVITLRYIADENGFQPIGDHLPKSPAASSSSLEKTGRSLKIDDSSISASGIEESKIKKPESSNLIGKLDDSSVDAAATPVEVGTALADTNVSQNEAAEVSTQPSPLTAIEDSPALTSQLVEESNNLQATEAAQPTTESEVPKTVEAAKANIDVSNEAASTPVPVQPTESEQGSTASAEQAFISTSNQSASESPSSTSATEQSGSTEAIGQSAPKDVAYSTPAEEAQSTGIPRSEESISSSVTNQ